MPHVHENALLWNDGDGRRPATDAGQSLYGAASKVFSLRPDGAYPFPTMTLTVGAGNGRFRREKDIVEDRSIVNPFGAASAIEKAFTPSGNDGRAPRRAPWLRD